VYGDFLPRSVFGRMHILCASARGLYLALMLGLHEPRADLFIVDQLATPIPVRRKYYYGPAVHPHAAALHWTLSCWRGGAGRQVLFLTGSRILFYCHFPDLKLSGVRSLLKAQSAATAVACLWLEPGVLARLIGSSCRLSGAVSAAL